MQSIISICLHGTRMPVPIGARQVTMERKHTPAGFGMTNACQSKAQERNHKAKEESRAAVIKALKSGRETMDALEAATGKSETTVKKRLHDLVDEGFVTGTRIGGNEYYWRLTEKGMAEL